MCDTCATKCPVGAISKEGIDKKKSAKGGCQLGKPEGDYPTHKGGHSHTRQGGAQEKNLRAQGL